MAAEQTSGYFVAAQVMRLTAADDATGIVLTIDGIGLMAGGRGLELRGLAPGVQRELAYVLLALAEARENEVAGHA